MAGGMHTKIMAKFAEIVGKVPQLDFIDQPQTTWSGRVYVQRDFVTLIEIGYNFGATVATFSVEGDVMRRYFWDHADILQPDEHGIRFHKHSTGGDVTMTLKYNDSHRLTKLFDLIGTLVAESVIKKVNG